ncbi:starch-binding domain-containing protein 1 [Cebus imitator]|uniref:Starch-binding domain-containing protein 1 n=1 Tax=Cebus imitator TaxID=2715852 RepID=A0A2K5PCK2_CEBIM|nr:starch-binding domain-containing protein 1 [Cebus imitator]
MGAVWSALLVGGGLAGALFVWLLRGGSGDTGKDGDAEQEKEAPLGGAAAPGGDPSGSDELSPGPSRQELVTKSEHLQESNGHLISKTKDLGSLQAAACRLQNPSREVCDNSREHVPSGQFPDTDAPATSETGNSRSHSEVSRNESLESPMREWGFQKGRETSAKAATCFAEKLPSSNLLTNRAKEEMSLSHLNSQDQVDHEEWEMVSRHSSWGNVGSLEAPVLSPNQGMDSGRSTLVEARDWQVHRKTEKVAVMPAGSQQVSVRFQVHYITSTDVQFIAITGDHECLGRWNTYIPLYYSKDGFWSHSIFLPADTVVEWKFVLVENGGVTRWEECSNRFLETGHEDKVVHAWWGIH